MRHLTIRLQLTWLTVIALAAFAMTAAIRPESGVLDAELARTIDEFRERLRPDASIQTLNLFRAHLAADMVFLVAYGLLLRQSVRLLGSSGGARLARHGAVLLMVADAIENLCALTVLHAIGQEQTALPPWLFVAMNVAALTKWTVAGLIMLVLAAGWRHIIPTLKGALKLVGAAVILFFAIAGLASFTVVASAVYPRVRSGAAAAALIAPAVALLLQFRLLDMIGIALRFVALARVPLIVLLITAVFGPIALGPAAGLLGGILDVPDWWAIGMVTSASIVLAFACGTQINLVRAYGWQRALDRTLRVLHHRVLGRAVTWTALVSVSSLLFSVALASARVTWPQLAAGIPAGILAALAFLFAVEWVAALLSQNTPGRVLPQLAMPFSRSVLLGDLLRDARDVSPPAVFVGAKGRLRKWSIAGKLFGLSSGYIEQLPNGARRLLPGHSFAIVQLALSLAFYVALRYFKAPGEVVSVERALWVPTAASVVVLLLLSSWALAGVTFFLDRYRTPLFTAVVGMAILTGSRAHTDYEIPTDTRASEQYELATPGRVLTAFSRPLVVTAAGGGIQAGAWTARVLEGIHAKLGEAFRDRAALISGVSGGSMGALYYGAFRDTSLATATKKALESSLDEVASALIGSDLLRVLGLRLGTDRGTALERSWALRLPSSPGDLTLRTWADDVRRFVNREPSARPFPAFLFNTTIVETGQPMAFATTQFPTNAYRESFSNRAKQYPVVESANRIFNLSPDGVVARDIRLPAVTAARLSAAFPYVSPASTLRIDEGAQRFHLVDGGYYDNYGLVAVAQWLDDALEEMAERPAEVGVIVIRGLAESGSGLVTELREGEERKELVAYQPNVPSRGWAWQVVAPPAAFLKTRSFGQWAGGNQVLKLLVEKWRERGVTIRPYLFDFPADRLARACQVAPLSWKLSAPQQDCIEKGWAQIEAIGSDLWSAASGAPRP